MAEILVKEYCKLCGHEAKYLVDSDEFICLQCGYQWRRKKCQKKAKF